MLPLCPCAWGYPGPSSARPSSLHHPPILSLLWLCPLPLFPSTVWAMQGLRARLAELIPEEQVRCTPSIVWMFSGSLHLLADTLTACCMSQKRRACKHGGGVSSAGNAGVSWVLCPFPVRRPASRR